MTRRSFLQAPVLAGAACFCDTPEMPSSAVRCHGAEVWVDLAVLEKMGDSAVVRDLPSAGDRLLLIREGKRWRAFSGKCTHGGSPVAFDAPRQQIQCICYGHSIFSLEQGAVRKGPAKRPLAVYPAKVDGSRLVIDTSPKVGDVWRNPVDGMEFAWIPAGRLTIGCAPDERCAEAIPASERQFAGFWMGRTEVTVGQYRRFVEATRHVTEPERAGEVTNWRDPGFAQGSEHPVVKVSFADALAYTRWAGVDLPNYFEWEYAARAGSPHRYHWGPEYSTDQAWSRHNTDYGTHPVAGKPPNAFGLFDTSGNVWEWSKWEGDAKGICPPKSVPRGGSWANCFKDSLVETNPFPKGKCPTTGGWNDDHGFRCIRRVAT